MFDCLVGYYQSCLSLPGFDICLIESSLDVKYDLHLTFAYIGQFVTMLYLNLESKLVATSPNNTYQPVAKKTEIEKKNNKAFRQIPKITGGSCLMNLDDR